MVPVANAPGATYTLNILLALSGDFGSTETENVSILLDGLQLDIITDGILNQFFTTTSVQDGSDVTISSFDDGGFPVSTVNTDRTPDRDGSNGANPNPPYTFFASASLTEAMLNTLGTSFATLTGDGTIVVSFDFVGTPAGINNRPGDTISATVAIDEVIPPGSSTVPEPGSLSLIALGGLGFFAARRRRAANSARSAA